MAILRMNLFALLVVVLAVACSNAHTYYEGEKQLIAGENAQAVKSFNEALDGDKLFTYERAHAYRLRGQANLALDKFADAISDFSNAISIDAFDIVAYYKRGIALKQTGDIGLAKNDFASVLQCYAKAKRRAAMITAQGSTHRKFISPRLMRIAASSHMALGEIALYEERYGEALEHMDAAVEMLPTNPEGYFLRGGALKLVEQSDIAEKDFASFINYGGDEKKSIDDSLGPLSLKNAISYYRNGDFASANQSATQALTINPKYAAAYRCRGLVCIKLDQLTEAVSDFSRAIEFEPENLEGYLYRAFSYIEMQDFKKAEVDCSHVLAIDPGRKFALFYRGIVNVGQEHYKEADDDFSLILEKYPSDLNTLEYRGLCRLKNARYADAIRDFNELIKIEPTRGEAHFLLGLAQLRKQDYAKTISSLNEAQRLGITRGELFLARSAAKRSLGQEKGAAEDFNSAMQSGLNDEDVNYGFDDLMRAARGMAEPGGGRQ